MRFRGGGHSLAPVLEQYLGMLVPAHRIVDHHLPQSLLKVILLDWNLG
jgi:hypothetical protein